MKNNTFLMLGLLLSSGLSFAAADTIAALTGGDTGAKTIDLTNTGEGDVITNDTNVGAGAVSVNSEIIIAINNCSGNAKCLNNIKSKTKGQVGANAIGDMGIGITISNAELLTNLNHSTVKIPVAGKTYVYTFMQDGNTYYVALQGSKLDRKLDLSINTYAAPDHETLVSVFINRNGEKVTSELNNGQYKFIEIGEFSLNSRKMTNKNNTPIDMKITNGKIQLVNSKVVFDFASALANG